MVRCLTCPLGGAELWAGAARPHQVRVESTRGTRLCGHLLCSNTCLKGRGNLLYPYDWACAARGQPFKVKSRFLRSQPPNCMQTGPHTFFPGKPPSDRFAGRVLGLLRVAKAGFRRLDQVHGIWGDVAQVRGQKRLIKDPCRLNCGGYYVSHRGFSNQLNCCKRGHSRISAVLFLRVPAGANGTQLIPSDPYISKIKEPYCGLMNSCLPIPPQEWAAVQGGRLRAMASYMVRITRRSTAARSAKIQLLKSLVGEFLAPGGVARQCRFCPFIFFGPTFPQHLIDNCNQLAPKSQRTMTRI